MIHRITSIGSFWNSALTRGLSSSAMARWRATLACRLVLWAQWLSAPSPMTIERHDSERERERERDEHSRGSFAQSEFDFHLLPGRSPTVRDSLLSCTSELPGGDASDSSPRITNDLLDCRCLHHRRITKGRIMYGIFWILSFNTTQHSSYSKSFTVHRFLAGIVDRGKIL
jgi:hypothetical protein